MTKSIYEIWLSTDDNKERFRIPVLPPSLEVSNGSKNETVDISNLGEVTILQDPASKMVRFSSFFPAQNTPLVEYENPPKPWDSVALIEKWKTDKKPLRLIVTKTNINLLVSAEEFEFREAGGAVGDLSYDLSLKEFKQSKVRKLTPEGPAKTTRPAPPKSGKTHTVTGGDTLWGIARKVYGNGADWRKIWDVPANKEMLTKRDSRNLKSPGHWIYPGQVIQLP